MASGINYSIKIIFLVLFLFFSFRLGLQTPFADTFLILEAAYIVLLLLFYCVRLLPVIIGKVKFTGLEIMISLLLLFPFIGSISAYSEFGQPLIYGLISERGFFLVLSGILLFYFIKVGLITLQQVKHSFIFLSWICLVYFVLGSELLDPLDYFKTGFVAYNKIKGGYIFRFTVTFITFAFLYYFILFFRNRNWKYLFYSLLFFAYLVFIRQDRSILLTASITAFVFFYFNIFMVSKIKYLLISLFSLIGIVIVLSFTNTDYFDKFKNIVDTLYGEETKEASTNMRRYEVALAAPYIYKNPVLGNGMLNNNWNGGFKRAVGYFFPSDIGLFGQMFVYGIVGTILINLQFVFGYKTMRKVQKNKYDPFFITCKYTLLSFFLDSLTAGQTAFFAANSIVLISILYSYYFLENKSVYLNE